MYYPVPHKSCAINIFIIFVRFCILVRRKVAKGDVLELFCSCVVKIKRIKVLTTMFERAICMDITEKLVSVLLFRIVTNIV